MTPRTVGGLNNSQSEHQVATWLLYRSLLPLSRILAVIQEFYMPSIKQQHQLSTPYHAQSSRWIQGIQKTLLGCIVLSPVTADLQASGLNWYTGWGKYWSSCSSSPTWQIIIACAFGSGRETHSFNRFTCNIRPDWSYPGITSSYEVGPSSLLTSKGPCHWVKSLLSWVCNITSTF